MANFFAQISTIFHNARLTSYGRKSLLKILLAGVLLWIAIHLFRLSNQIPYSKAAVLINTEGPEYVDLDLRIAVGNHSNKGFLRDSSMNRLVPFSGNWGIYFEINAKQTPKYLYTDYWINSINQIIEANPQVLKKPHPYNLIDSVNARIYTVYSFESNSVLPFVTKKLQERFVSNHFTDTLYHIDDSLGCYSVAKSEPYSINSFEGDGAIFFKDSLIANDLAFAHYSHSSRFNINNPFYGNLNRELKDISRSYVFVRVAGCSYTAADIMPNEKSRMVSVNKWQNQLPDHFKLTIDFGSPVSLAAVQPEPDIVGLTYVSYTDPEKLKYILGKSDLLFFVKYLENENRQSMRLFWLTTVITALATWIVTVAWKWIEYGTRRRRFAKRRLQQG